MTTDQFIASQRSKMTMLKQGNIFRAAVIATQRKIAERIFIKGKSVSTTIGYYDDDHGIYVNPKDSPKKFPPQGKPRYDGSFRGASTKSSKRVSKSLRSDGSERKTRYFASYKAYRQFIGRDTDFVNLDLSGRLRSNFISGLKKVSTFEWISELTKENKNKADGVEKHFRRKIFAFSYAEKQYFTKMVSEFTIKVLKDGIQSTESDAK